MVMAALHVVGVGLAVCLGREHALLCVAQGKHILVEKPIACNATDAQEMVDKVRQTEASQERPPPMHACTPTRQQRRPQRLLACWLHRRRRDGRRRGGG